MTGPRLAPPSGVPRRFVWFNVHPGPCSASPGRDASRAVCILLTFVLFLVAQFLIWRCFRSCEPDDRECERRCLELYGWLTLVVPIVIVLCFLLSPVLM